LEYFADYGLAAMMTGPTGVGKSCLIHDHTVGIPRAINNLATTCLIHAASKDLKRINAALVVEAAAELRML